MKVGIALLFALQIGLCFGFYPELFYDGPVDSLEEYGNVDEIFQAQPGHGCRKTLGEAEAEEIKLIFRLKRMAGCRGGVQSV